ncbi:hypothetical protein PAEPH01_2434, partial [Pancytospora epiphaga]
TKDPSMSTYEELLEYMERHRIVLDQDASKILKELHAIELKRWEVAREGGLDITTATIEEIVSSLVREGDTNSVALILNALRPATEFLEPVSQNDAINEGFELLDDVAVNNETMVAERNLNAVLSLSTPRSVASSLNVGSLNDTSRDIEVISVDGNIEVIATENNLKEISIDFPIKKKRASTINNVVSVRDLVNVYANVGSERKAAGSTKKPTNSSKAARPIRNAAISSKRNVRTEYVPRSSVSFSETEDDISDLVNDSDAESLNNAANNYNLSICDNDTSLNDQNIYSYNPIEVDNSFSAEAELIESNNDTQQQEVSQANAQAIMDKLESIYCRQENMHKNFLELRETVEKHGVWIKEIRDSLSIITTLTPLETKPDSLIYTTQCDVIDNLSLPAGDDYAVTSENTMMSNKTASNQEEQLLICRMSNIFGQTAFTMNQARKRLFNAKSRPSKELFTSILKTLMLNGKCECLNNLEGPLQYCIKNVPNETERAEIDIEKLYNKLIKIFLDKSIKQFTVKEARSKLYCAKQKHLSLDLGDKLEKLIENGKLIKTYGYRGCVKFKFAQTLSNT